MATYLLTITGPDEGDAGAHWASEVRVTMFGTRASSPEFPLSRARQVGALPNLAPTYCVELSDLGQLERLRVRYDDSGITPGYYLERIEVRAANTSRAWGVDCRQWFSRHQVDGVTECTYDLVENGFTS